MFNIRLLNKISPAGIAVLDKATFRCGGDVENPQGIVVRSANMHGMDLPDSLLAVARAGAGTNNIPVDEMTKRGVVVFNTPGANANAVKELTMAGLLLSARKIYPSILWTQSLKGKGDEVQAMIEQGKGKFTGPELQGKKLGVVGLGAIGVLVCNFARHFDMDVYGYDPYLSVDTAWKLDRSVRHATSLQEIYENCDFITLHLPVTAETKGMINSQSIASMKHGVRILNFSRGELVENEDIVAAVAEKQVYCYITDFPSEELLGHYGIITLPHLGASTPESEINCAKMAARQIRDFLETGNITNSVNLPDVHVPFERGKTRATIIHRNIPNMISQITGAASGSNIHRLTNNNRGEVAYTVMDLDGGMVQEIVEKLNNIEGVIRVTLIQ